MSVTAFLKKYAIAPALDGDSIKLSGLSKLSKADAQSVIEYAQNHKREIITEIKIQHCASCPAGAEWAYGSYKGKGLICFYDAYFRGRAGKPAPCSMAICPKNNERVIL
jgi:hypothetical protein